MAHVPVSLNALKCWGFLVFRFLAHVCVKGQVIGADGKVIFADPLGSFSTASSLDMAKAPGRCRFDPYKECCQIREKVANLGYVVFLKNIKTAV